MYLLISTPYCYGASETANHYNANEAFDDSEVVGWFTSLEEADAEFESRWARFNPEHGPPKRVLHIAQVLPTPWER